jgi:hypothetical protein
MRSLLVLVGALAFAAALILVLRMRRATVSVSEGEVVSRSNEVENDASPDQTKVPAPSVTDANGSAGELPDAASLPAEQSSPPSAVSPSAAPDAQHTRARPPPVDPEEQVRLPRTSEEQEASDRMERELRDVVGIDRAIHIMKTEDRWCDEVRKQLLSRERRDADFLFREAGDVLAQHIRDLVPEDDERKKVGKILEHYAAAACVGMDF